MKGQFYKVILISILAANVYGSHTDGLKDDQSQSMFKQKMNLKKELENKLKSNKNRMIRLESEMGESNISNFPKNNSNRPKMDNESRQNILDNKRDTKDVAKVFNSQGYNQQMNPENKASLRKAFQNYSEAAQMGDVHAMINLGTMYYDGAYVIQDYEKAFEWWSKASKQEQYYSSYALGLLYFYGYHVSKDEKEALKLLKQAADLGNPFSMVFLGTLSKDKREYKTAFDWYEKAANLKDEKGANYLADMYENGWGVTKDLQKAQEWRQKAKEFRKSN